MLSAASRGVLVGAVAGAVLALNDFGATWLWLDTWSDRRDLFVRLVGLEIPAVATLFAVGATAVRVTSSAIRRWLPGQAARYADTHAFTVVAAPACVWIAWKLFTGGTASRLPMLWLLRPLAAVALIVVCWAATRVVERLTRSATSRAAAAWLTVAAITAAHVVIKVNQWVLPQLYDYLHSAAAIVAALLVAVAAGTVLDRTAVRDRLAGRLGTWVLIGLLPLWLGWSWTLRALPSNPNVNVTLLDARAIHARSLMLALAPLLSSDRPRASDTHTPTATADASTVPLVHEGPAATGAHLLLITIDALRADHLGTYGYARPTSPEIDQFAADSWRFEHAYTQAPHSSYALSSLMASEYLHETLDLGAPLPTDTLPRALHNAGYHTAAFYTRGIFHTGAERLQAYDDEAFGFALHDHRDRQPEALTDRVLEEVDRQVSLGEPATFVWAHYFNVHEPYEATTFGTTDMDRYDSEILRADAAVARLIREVRARFTRNVIVVITADHGEEFREHGGVYHGSSLYDEQVRVPLILSAPGAGSRQIAAPVELVDVAPTLLSMLGVTVPPGMRGDDLRAIADNEEAAPPAFSAVIHKRMVVRWPHKLAADLRFGLYELYDLANDPTERKNLASTEPDTVKELRGLVYEWLDSLATPTAVHDPHQQALDQGRLGDRRAVPTLVSMLTDASTTAEARASAARVLGKLADPDATTALRTVLSDAEPVVQAEAAIALGRMLDPTGRSELQRLVQSEDPDVRARSAVSLARLRDPASIPALIDALWIAPDDYEREEAIRWLGRIGDARAIEPLISLLPEGRTRHLVVIALGAIGDPRVFDTLVNVLSWERHATIRDAVVRGLGLLKDARALPVLLPLATTEPTLKYLTESLVRLDALHIGALGGADLRDRTPRKGFGRCTSFSERHDWDYLHRTVCPTARTRATVTLRVPDAIADAEAGSDVVVSLRRVDSQDPATLAIRLGQHHVGSVTVDKSWSEERLQLPAGLLRSGEVAAQLDASPPAARFEIDHILLVPR